MARAVFFSTLSLQSAMTSTFSTHATGKKSIAIMQPYFLPYLGYFQLIEAVDKFVVFDDVNYIRGGWINRNRMLVHGSPHLFTIPLQGASQNRRICDIALLGDAIWRDKLLRTFNQAYGQAPHHRKVMDVLERIVHFPSLQLDRFLLNSLQQLMRYMGIQTELHATSRTYANDALAGEHRIIDICVREGASDYVNPSGGTNLYHHDNFAREGIALHFLQSRASHYPQGKHAHVAGLSIIDVLMHNSPGAITQLLAERDFA